MLSAHSSIALNQRKRDSLDDHAQAAQALSQSFKNENGNSNPIASFKVVILINCDDLPDKRFVSNQKKELQQIQYLMNDNQQQQNN